MDFENFNVHGRALYFYQYHACNYTGLHWCNRLETPAAGVLCARTDCVFDVRIFRAGAQKT